MIFLEIAIWSLYVIGFGLQAVKYFQLHRLFQEEEEAREIHIRQYRELDNWMAYVFPEYRQIETRLKRGVTVGQILVSLCLIAVVAQKLLSS